MRQRDHGIDVRPEAATAASRGQTWGSYILNIAPFEEIKNDKGERVEKNRDCSSVVWILGAGIYTFVATSDADVKYASGLTLACEESHNGRGSDECDKRSTDYLAEVAPYEPIKAALVALIPVPLGWGFSYLVLFLVRWVKRGFMRTL